MMAGTKNRAVTKWRDHTIISLLDKLARERELDSGESLLMERTVRRITPPREIWRWTEKEDRTLKVLIRKWPRLRQQKPYQPNDHIRNLAKKMGRTEMAIYRRMERLRKRMKCSSSTADKEV